MVSLENPSFTHYLLIYILPRKLPCQVYTLLPPYLTDGNMLCYTVSKTPHHPSANKEVLLYEEKNTRRYSHHVHSDNRRCFIYQE